LAVSKTTITVVTIPLHGANSTQAEQAARLLGFTGKELSQSPYTGRTQLKFFYPFGGNQRCQISHNPLTRGELNSRQRRARGQRDEE